MDAETSQRESGAGFKPAGHLLALSSPEEHRQNPTQGLRLEHVQREGLLHRSTQERRVPSADFSLLALLVKNPLRIYPAQIHLAQMPFQCRH